MITWTTQTPCSSLSRLYIQSTVNMSIHLTCCADTGIFSCTAGFPAEHHSTSPAFSTARSRRFRSLSISALRCSMKAKDVSPLEAAGFRPSGSEAPAGGRGLGSTCTKLLISQRRRRHPHVGSARCSRAEFKPCSWSPPPNAFFENFANF